MAIKQALFSSIGKKVLLATSGLIMFLMFLVPHMGGNVLFLFGPDIFNAYAHHLHKLVWLLIQMEIVMLSAITIHMFMGIRVVLANLKAKSRRISQKSSEERSLAARLMPLSGTLIFIFIVKHLIDFKFHEKASITLHGEEAYDVYAIVLSRFQSDPVHVAIYVLFMIAVGLHLSHALQSSLQTFGLYIPRKRSMVKLLSTLVACGMAGTFSIIPIVAFFR